MSVLGCVLDYENGSLRFDSLSAYQGISPKLKTYTSVELHIKMEI
jgi:hypothetical protein